MSYRRHLGGRQDGLRHAGHGFHVDARGTFRHLGRMRCWSGNTCCRCRLVGRISRASRLLMLIVLWLLHAAWIALCTKCSGRLVAVERLLLRGTGEDLWHRF